MHEAEHWGLPADGAAQGPIQVLELAPGALLFREGELKAGIYCVGSGAICTYRASPSAHPGQDTPREFSYGGDWLGFGYLDRQICRARAIVATRVYAFPRSAAIIVAERDARARRRLADAIEREFEFQREARAGGAPAPVARVAAFLASLASLNRNEGRDPRIVVESMSCGLVADTLSMSIDALSAALLALERRGMIEPRLPQGLCLRDIAGLEAIAAESGPATTRPRTTAPAIDAEYRTLG